MNEEALVITKLEAKQIALEAREEARQQSVEQHSHFVIDTIYRNIRIQAKAQAGCLRYDMPTMMPAVLRYVIQYFADQGFTVKTLTGTNTFHGAREDEVIGFFIIWLDYRQ